MTDNEREGYSPPSRFGDADSKEREPSRREDCRPSRSPRRDRHGDRPKRKDKGFKWKEKRRDDDDGRDRGSGLQRGYRDHYRPRSRSRSPRPRSPRLDDRDGDRRRDRREGADRKEPKQADAERNEIKEEKRKKTKPALPQEPMILVTINDRLGTKKQVPCFASDSVGAFKHIVAAMIGRQPHEILLKRQGERPFKDQLTLQDYGVSNNVQLDLEVDTGD